MSAPSLGVTLGAIELGGVFATFFFGIVSMQVYNYFRDYPKDSLKLKAMVMTTWALEFVHTALLWHSIFLLTITFFCDANRVFTPPRTLYVVILLSILITTTVQIFFANSIRLFSKQWLIPIITWVLAIAVSVGIIVIVVFLCIEDTLTILVDVESFHRLTIGILVLTAAVDIIIAVVMCYHLGRVRSSDFQKTSRIIDTLIAWSIESTVVKSGASLVQLVLFLTRKDFLWVIFMFSKASLFSNSMMASLNARNRMINGGNDSSNGATFINLNSGVGAGLGSPLAARTRVSGHGCKGGLFSLFPFSEHGHPNDPNDGDPY
ncbi:hypothetical protein K438DRAFT_256732 [Mycena galopus ATCC 62051]|nr:hypothetical protein K438DRAFT_256732 [Mycena galopus ATCC 62051]